MAATKLFFAGSGGQGVLTMGQMLTYAAMYADMNATWLPSYGPEMRGGTANCSVILSDDPVGSPIVSHPDVLIAMNLPSLEKYEDTVVPGGMILVESTLIEKKVARDDVKVFYVPATKMAQEMGAPTLANMIMVGKLIRECEAVNDGHIEETLHKVVSARHQDLFDINKKAIQAGMDLEG